MNFSRGFDVLLYAVGNRATDGPVINAEEAAVASLVPTHNWTPELDSQKAE